jgi:hypothetical protein
MVFWESEELDRCTLNIARYFIKIFNNLPGCYGAGGKIEFGGFCRWLDFYIWGRRGVLAYAIFFSGCLRGYFAGVPAGSDCGVL